MASYPEYHQIKDAKILPHGMDTQSILDRLKQEILQDYERFSDMNGLRVDYEDGWFLVRASGTEPKVRVFFRGEDRGEGKEIEQGCDGGAVEGDDGRKKIRNGTFINSKMNKLIQKWKYGYEIPQRSG